jgi:hypothetical protein
MAGDPHKPAATVSWFNCSAIAAFAVALVGLGDLQVPTHAGSPGAVVASEDGHVNLTLIPVVHAKEKPLMGNPLWAVPLSVLSETVARPVFSPSRRPPSPPVVAAPFVPPAKTPPPTATESDHPMLTLLGTIVGELDGIGIFLDEASNKAIRLRAGQVHGGWTLRSVRRRAANFERDQLEATLELSPPGVEKTTLSVAAGPTGTEREGTRGNDQTVGPPSGNRVRPRPRKL